MDHNHPPKNPECVHDDVKYCNDCDVMYCVACRKEWKFENPFEKIQKDFPSQPRWPRDNGIYLCVNKDHNG